mgnify:CR=1 FL=1
MKCNVCGQEFGNGAYCQHCNADRITALGNYSGGYNAPDSPKNVTSNTSVGETNPISGYGSGNDLRNSSKQNVNRNSGEQFMVCYNCANVIPIDSEYCPCCRTKLYEVCPKCGHRYSSQYKICNKCGTDREGYLAEQRILEQRRQEEARRKEEEHKRILEEERRRRERQRLEEELRTAEERQRQLEVKRKEKRQKEEAQRQEAELIRRIESSDAYKEAYEWIMEAFSIIQEKRKRLSHFDGLFSIVDVIAGILILTAIYAAIIGDWSDRFLIILVASLAYCVIIMIVVPLIDHKLDMRFLERSFSDRMFHNNLAQQAIRRYIDEIPKDDKFCEINYNGELLEIFKNLMTNKENNL